MRNSLNGHCYWLLRKLGLPASEVQARISEISNSEKNEILFSNGINYNDLPSWQKRGVGLFFRDETKQGYNPKTKETTITTCVRSVLHLEEDLPIGERYSEMLRRLIDEQ